jgi:hypothetical protein
LANYLLCANGRPIGWMRELRRSTGNGAAAPVQLSREAHLNDPHALDVRWTETAGPDGTVREVHWHETWPGGERLVDGRVEGELLRLTVLGGPERREFTRKFPKGTWTELTALERARSGQLPDRGLMLDPVTLEVLPLEAAAIGSCDVERRGLRRTIRGTRLSWGGRRVTGWEALDDGPFRIDLNGPSFVAVRCAADPVETLQAEKERRNEDVADAALLVPVPEIGGTLALPGPDWAVTRRSEAGALVRFVQETLKMELVLERTVPGTPEQALAERGHGDGEFHGESFPWGRGLVAERSIRTPAGERRVRTAILAQGLVLWGTAPADAAAALRGEMDVALRSLTLAKR